MTHQRKTHLYSRKLYSLTPVKAVWQRSSEKQEIIQAELVFTEEATAELE